MAQQPRLEGLEGLPKLVLEQTIDNLDVKSRIAVRKTCKRLRWITDILKTDLNISVEHSKNMISISADLGDDEELEVEYWNHPEGCLVKGAQKEKLLRNENFLEIFMIDIKDYLASPRTTILRLAIKEDSSDDPEEEMFFSESITSTAIYTRMKALFETFGQKLTVESLDFRNAATPEQVMQILPFCEKGVLQDISINRPIDETWRPIIETEQWKKATVFRCEHSDLPVEEFFHFRNVSFHRERFELNDFLKFIETACQPPYDVQYHLYVYVNTPDPAIEDYLQQFPSLRPIKRDHIRHIKFPNYDSHVQVHCHSHEIVLRTVRNATLFSNSRSMINF